MPAQKAFEELKAVIEGKQYTDFGCLNLLDSDELFEQNYSKIQISDIQKEFMALADNFLSENYPGEFIIFKDWCVHVATLTYGEKYLSNERAYVVCR